MVVLNATAFGMYRLFGTFGPFHVAAVVSALTMFAAASLRVRRTARQVEPTSSLYWSVLGLYAAFFSELMVRVRINAAFMVLVSIATGATIFLGALFQNRLVRRWSAEVQDIRPE
ncbi:MAG: hypothetical protein IPJ87_15265 [Flavobacteriales bacterium]|nr:hypothetical protein [Flavobacteriales bacterium]